MRDKTLGDVVEAINDLTRAVVATSGRYKTKAEAIRALTALNISAPRIASILAMEPKDVHSVLSADKKKQQGAKSVGKE
jgi:hypothetical protein